MHAVGRATMKLPASGNCTRCGAAQLTVKPRAPARGSSLPEQRRPSGQAAEMDQQHASPGTAIANTLIQNWNACT